jgi:hypothetical protein
LPNGTITLSPVSNPAANTAFTIGATLQVTPQVSYKDDGGAAQAVTVAAFSKAFTVNHPGLASGSHSVVVSDAVTGASATAAVTVPAAASVVFIGASQSLTTSNGTVYRLDNQLNAYKKPAGGNEISLGGINPIGWNAESMAYDGTTVYIEDVRDHSWWVVGNTSFTGPVPKPTGGTTPPPPPGVPAPAAAVGYNTQTFGPNVTLGQNWFAMAGADVVQNADGSVTDRGGTPNHFNHHVTAVDVSSQNAMKGTAFKGGGYYEWELSFTGDASEQQADGWPAFWLNGMEGDYGFSFITKFTGNEQVEYDAAEWGKGASNNYGAGIIDWNCVPGGGTKSNLDQGKSGVATVPGVNFSQKHKYGFLHVPATDTSDGYVKNYFDGQQVGDTYTWSKHTGQGSPLFSIMDLQHFLFIFGTGTANPLTVYSFRAWQKD